MKDADDLDYEDDAVAEAWCAEMRVEVEDYLKAEEAEYGEISEWPAWHVAPYASVWALESATEKGFVGAWVICGDLPTDLIDGDNIKHPREAMAAIADRWLQFVANARAGKPNDDFSIDGGDNPAELISMLQSRAETLRSWAADETIWADDR